MVDDDGAKKWLAEHKGIPETGFLSSHLHVIVQEFSVRTGARSAHVEMYRTGSWTGLWGRYYNCHYYFAKREHISGFFSALWRVTPINKACVWSRHDANATDVGKMTLRWLLALCLMRRMPH
jgi:hypothetical protein